MEYFSQPAESEKLIFCLTSFFIIHLLFQFILIHAYTTGMVGLQTRTCLGFDWPV